MMSLSPVPCISHPVRIGEDLLENPVPFIYLSLFPVYIIRILCTVVVTVVPSYPDRVLCEHSNTYSSTRVFWEVNLGMLDQQRVPRSIYMSKRVLSAGKQPSY